MDKRLFNPNSLNYGDIVQDRVTGNTGKVLKKLETLGVISIVVYFFFDKSTKEVSASTINLLQKAENNIFSYVSEKANTLNSWKDWKKSDKTSNYLPKQEREAKFAEWLKNDPRTKQYQPKVTTPNSPGKPTPTYKIGNKEYFGSVSWGKRNVFTKNIKGEIVKIDPYNTYPLNYGQTGYDVYHINAAGFLAEIPPKVTPSVPEIKQPLIISREYGPAHINDILYEIYHIGSRDSNRFFTDILGNKDLETFFSGLDVLITLPNLLHKKQKKEIAKIFGYQTFLKRFLEPKNRDMEDFIDYVGRKNLSNIVLGLRSGKKLPKRIIEGFASRFPYTDTGLKTSGYERTLELIATLKNYSWNSKESFKIQLKRLLDNRSKQVTLKQISSILGDTTFSKLLKDTPGASEYIWNTLTHTQKSKFISQHLSLSDASTAVSGEREIKSLIIPVFKIDYSLRINNFREFTNGLMKEENWIDIYDVSRIKIRKQRPIGRNTSNNFFFSTSAVPQTTWNRHSSPWGHSNILTPNSRVTLFSSIFETDDVGDKIARHIYKKIKGNFYNPISGQRGIPSHPNLVDETTPQIDQLIINRFTDKFDMVAWTYDYIKDTERDIKIIKRITARLEGFNPTGYDPGVKSIIDVVSNLLPFGLDEGHIQRLRDTIDKNNSDFLNQTKIERIREIINDIKKETKRIEIRKSLDLGKVHTKLPLLEKEHGIARPDTSAFMSNEISEQSYNYHMSEFDPDQWVEHRNSQRNSIYKGLKSSEEWLIDAVTESRRKNSGAIFWGEVALTLHMDPKKDRSTLEYRYNKLVKARKAKGNFDRHLELEHQIKSNPTGYVGQRVLMQDRLYGTIQHIDIAKGTALVLPDTEISSKEAFGTVQWESGHTLYNIFHGIIEEEPKVQEVKKVIPLTGREQRKLEQLYEKNFPGDSLYNSIKNELSLEIKKYYNVGSDLEHTVTENDLKQLVHLYAFQHLRYSKDFTGTIQEKNLKNLVIKSIIEHHANERSVKSDNFSNFDVVTKDGIFNLIDNIESRDIIRTIFRENNKDISRKFLSIARNHSHLVEFFTKDDEFPQIAQIINNALLAINLVNLEEVLPYDISGQIQDITHIIKNRDPKEESIISMEYIENTINSMYNYLHLLNSRLETSKNKPKIQKQINAIERGIGTINNKLKTKTVKLKTDVTLNTYSLISGMYKQLTRGTEEPVIRMSNDRHIQNTGRTFKPTKVPSPTRGRATIEGSHIKDIEVGLEGIPIWRDLTTGQEFVFSESGSEMSLHQLGTQLSLESGSRIYLTDPKSMRSEPEKLGIYKYDNVHIGQHTGKDVQNFPSRIETVKKLQGSGKTIVGVDIEAEAHFQGWSHLGQVGIVVHDVDSETELRSIQMTYQGWEKGPKTKNGFVLMYGNDPEITHNLLYYIKDPQHPAQDRQFNEISMLLETHVRFTELIKSKGMDNLVFASYNDNADISKLKAMADRHIQNLKMQGNENRVEIIASAKKLRELKSKLRLIVEAEERVEDIGSKSVNVVSTDSIGLNMIRPILIARIEEKIRIINESNIDLTESTKYERIIHNIMNNSSAIYTDDLRNDPDILHLVNTFLRFRNNLIKKRANNISNTYLNMIPKDLEEHKRDILAQIKNITDKREILISANESKRIITRLKEASDLFETIHNKHSLDIMAFESIFAGYRQGLGPAHQTVFGKKHEDAHKSVADVRAMIRLMISRMKSPDGYKSLDPSKAVQLSVEPDFFTKIYSYRSSRNERQLSNRFFRIKDIRRSYDKRSTEWNYEVVLNEIGYDREIISPSYSGQWGLYEFFSGLRDMEGLDNKEIYKRRNLKVKDLARRNLERFLNPAYEKPTVSTQPGFLYINQKMEYYKKYFSQFDLNGKNNSQIIAKVESRLQEIEDILSGNFGINNDLKTEKYFLKGLLGDTRLIHQYREMQDWYDKHFVHADKKFFDQVGSLYQSGTIKRYEAEFLIKDRYDRLYKPLSLKDHKYQLGKINELKSQGKHEEAKQLETELSLKYKKVNLETTFENSFITPQIPGFDNNYSIAVGTSDLINADLTEFATKGFLRSYGHTTKRRYISQEGTEILREIFPKNSEYFNAIKAIKKSGHNEVKEKLTRELIKKNIPLGIGLDKQPIRSILGDSIGDINYDAHNLTTAIFESIQKNKEFLELAGDRSAFGTDILQPTFGPEHQDIIDRELRKIQTIPSMILESEIPREYEKSSQLRTSILTLVLGDSLSRKLNIYMSEGMSLTPQDISKRKFGKYKLAYLLEQNNIGRFELDKYQRSEMEDLVGYTYFRENSEALIKATSKGKFGDITIISKNGTTQKLNAGNLPLYFTESETTLAKLVEGKEEDVIERLSNAGYTYTGLHKQLIEKYYSTDRKDDNIAPKDVALEMIKAAQEATLNSPIKPKVNMNTSLADAGRLFQHYAGSSDTLAETVKIISGTTAGKVLGIGLAAALTLGIGLRKEPDTRKESFDRSELDYVQPEGAPDQSSDSITNTHQHYEIQAHITARTGRKVNTESLVGSLHGKIENMFNGTVQKSHKINDDRRPVNKNSADRVFNKIL